MHYVLIDKSVEKMASVEVDLGVTPETTYSVRGKQLKFDAKKDIEPYLNELESKSNLLKLDFSGNTIGIEASEALAAAILKHKDTLVEVDFSDLYTGRLNTEIPQSLGHLLPAFLQCSHLKIVNLSDNAFGLQTIDPIEDYLAKAVSIEHLILSNNGMGPFAGARIGKSLYKLSQAKKQQGKVSLKTFICGRNRLENGSTNYLSIGLRNHEDLLVVKLYQNGIRPNGIKNLIKNGLSQNKKLQVIDLQDNTLTTKASVILANALSNWNDLSELNLNDCLMKPQGSLKLCQALEEGMIREAFTTLRIQYNELESLSLDHLLKAIEKKLPKLKLLELNGNRFDEDAEFIEKVNEIFEVRGVGELDELDDLEEIDSEEEDEDEEEEEEEEEEDLDQLEKELAGVHIGGDDLDELSGELAKTHIQ